MNDRITLTGKIGFEPEDKTKKHINQASWKKIAMVFIESEVCEYYAWFIKKRFNIVLNKPIRGAHISFINDSMKDLTQNGKISEEETLKRWEEVRKKWDGKEIKVVLDLNPRTDNITWWLNVPHDEREELQSIRNELGLGKPYYGMHMTIGNARPGINEEQSIYIHQLIINGFISLN